MGYVGVGICENALQTDIDERGRARGVFLDRDGSRRDGQIVEIGKGVQWPNVGGRLKGRIEFKRCSRCSRSAGTLGGGHYFGEARRG